MFEFLTEAFKALSAYPIVQAAVAILVLLFGITIMRRGERDRKAGGTSFPEVPVWLLYGPADAAVKSITKIEVNTAYQLELQHDQLNMTREIIEVLREINARLDHRH